MDNRCCNISRGLCASLLVLVMCGIDASGQQPRRQHPASSSSTQQFTEKCDNPKFPSPEATPIDSACGLSGAGVGAAAAQNELKNNFCASGTTPKLITVDDLKNLQAQVESFSPAINFGDKDSPDRPKGPTKDRGPLQQMGEGGLVTLRGYVFKARQEGAESVNCAKNVPNQPAYHDIHISIVSSHDETSECSGVVVEMSPHHRPQEWTAANLGKVVAAALPVRVTGNLFFDSAHVPCKQGQPASGNPSRISLWEVHPVYTFEVCTGACDGAGQWKSLADWLNQ
jgi:hypothetical protein